MTDLALPLWCLIIAIVVHALVTWRCWQRSLDLSERSHESIERTQATMDLSTKNLEEIRLEEKNLFKISVEAATGRKIKDMSDAEVLSLVRDEPVQESTT